MNNGPVIFLTLFVAMAGSWLSFILGPVLQLGDAKPSTALVLPATKRDYPVPQTGSVNQGAEVYRANGCAACHTQQIRPQSGGADIARGWGLRRSTANDYLYASPVLLGSLRVGPDLANAGSRMDSKTVLMRLYNPRLITEKSVMPSYPYLFEKHKVAGIPSAEALPLSKEFAPEAGYEIIPKPEALMLAGYIVGLHQQGYLFEAPPTTEAVDAAKQAAAAAAKAQAATNAPAK